LLSYNHAFSHVSNDLYRTPETAPSNPRVSIESSLRTTVLDLSQFHNISISKCTVMDNPYKR